MAGWPGVLILANTVTIFGQKLAENVWHHSLRGHSVHVPADQASLAWLPCYLGAGMLKLCLI